MDRRRPDRPRALAAVLAFSFSLGVGGLVLPLAALASGYDAAAVGLLAATSAVSQLAFRLGLPQLLGRYPDRLLITGSCLTMALSYALLLGSRELPVFVAAQLLQGMSRAVFWTASQTHAVRANGSAVRLLAEVGAVGNVGQMVAPLVTGILVTIAIELALSVGIVAGLVGALLAGGLSHLDPYARRSRNGEPMLWRRPGVDAAGWAAFAGGGWRVMMSSYVPVVLTTAGLTPGVIGALLSAADFASLIAITALIRMPPRRSVVTMDLAVLAACIGLALVPFAASQPLLVGALLMLSGAGAGPITALAAAVARQSARPEEEGDAIALTGTFRAVALLAVPTLVAATLSMIALAPAVTGVTVLMGVPTLVARAIRHR